MGKAKESYIYIISDGEDNLKIGVSVNPERRVKQLSTGSATHLLLLYKFKMSADVVFQIEQQCHEEANHLYEKKGEWFIGALSFDIRNLVENLCENHIIEEKENP